MKKTARNYEQGLEHQMRGDLDTAKTCFLAVLHQDPKHSDALHCLGSIDAKKGDFETGEDLVRRAVAINPMQAGYYATLASILNAQKKKTEAEKVYHQGLRLKPDLVVLHDGLGLLHYESGELHKAADCYLKALEIDPNNAGVYNNLGRALNNLGKLDEAADVFRRSIQIQPEFADAHNNLGHVLRAQSRFAKAKERFSEAIRLDPNFASAHHNLGTIQMTLGELDRAIQSFETTVALSPKDVLAHINLGIACHTAGRIKKSERAYGRAIEVDPENSNAHYGLAIVLNEQRKIEEAEAAVRRAIELEPTHVDAYAELAAICEEMNRLDELEEVISKALEIAPDHPRTNLEAAKQARRLGKFEEAIARLERFEPSTLNQRLRQHYHYELGLSYDQLDNVDRAFRHFKEANENGRRSERVKTLNPSAYLDKIDRLHSFFSSTDLGSWSPASEPDDRRVPVFMYGFPRSGTTLTDVLLDGHQSIQTLEEKPTISTAEAGLMASEAGYPAALAEIDEQGIEELRTQYFQEVDRHVQREPDKILVDKMPIRTVHAGLIWRMFPSAKIIFSARHPCDVVLSGFMQQFHPNTNAFANFFSLEDAVRIYDKVMNLWQLYASTLPLDCYVLKYEELVGDLEGQTRSLVDFLGLQWDPKLLDYGERVRERKRIFTNSYHQVSQPVYTRARYRWLRYRTYLEPHLPTLSPHIEYFGYAQE